MEYLIGVFSVFGIVSVAIVFGKLVAKIKLPAILGWLIAGVIFGPYLVEFVSQSTLDSIWYKISIKFFECFAGVMIGKEILFNKIKSSGKQIIGITFVQSIGTFLFVSLVFSIVFLIIKIPIYLAFIFGGIALATAPAPALAIVNEYKTDGPVTKTLIPLAAIDDVIGVVVFFTIISIVSAIFGNEGVSVLSIIGTIVLPFIIGILTGFICSFIIKHIKRYQVKLILLIVFLLLSSGIGLLVDLLIFKSFSLNYLLIGMSFSATLVNMVKEEELKETFKAYNPLLTISLIIVIVNLGMPLNYKLIAGAGLFTFIYILARAIGKIGFSYIGGKMTKADKKVTNFLGLTLLPHSGVSLIFTGIAASTLEVINPELASIIQGTICAAAIINEIIAVIIAKYAFKWAGEIRT